ncbi:hypothetical protein IAT38_007376 [Cryptococcus sp. DSM 104549]
MGTDADHPPFLHDTFPEDILSSLLSKALNLEDMPPKRPNTVSSETDAQDDIVNKKCRRASDAIGGASYDYGEPAKKPAKKVIRAREVNWGDIPDWQGSDACPLLDMPFEVLELCFGLNENLGLTPRDYLSLAGVSRFFRNQLTTQIFCILRQFDPDVDLRLRPVVVKNKAILQASIVVKGLAHGEEYVPPACVPEEKYPATFDWQLKKEEQEVFFKRWGDVQIVPDQSGRAMLAKAGLPPRCRYHISDARELVAKAIMQKRISARAAMEEYKVTPQELLCLSHLVCIGSKFRMRSPQKLYSLAAVEALALRAKSAGARKR